MSARARILGRVRSAGSRHTAHPGPFAAAAQPSDWSAFATALRAAGGEPRGPATPERLSDTVRSLLAEWHGDGDGRVVADARAHALLGPGPWQAAEGEPHALADVAVAVVAGSLGVAESGAVLVETDGAGCGADPVEGASSGALPFLCERLILLVPLAAILPELHATMARLEARGPLPPRAVWISGPSKTADIEQALVFGAHGPLACAVVGIAEAVPG